MLTSRRIKAVLTVAAAAALSLTACSSSKSGSGGTGTASSAPKLQTVDLLLDFSPSPYEAPITWGEQQGIWAKAGIKLNIQSSTGSQVSVPEVNTGKVKFGFGSYDVYIGDRLKGAGGSTPIEVYENIPTTGIISAKPITDLHQLVGKSFGDVANSSGITYLQYLLKKNNIDPKSVPLKLLSFSVLYTEFYQHNLFAAEMDEPGDEDALSQAKKIGVPATYTPLSNFGLTGYSAVLLANNDTVKNDPDLVKRFATAMYECEKQSVATATDDDIVKDFQNLAPTKKADDILAAWHDFKVQVTGFGTFDPKVVSSILDRVKVDNNIQTTQVTASDLYDNSFLPAQ